MNSALQLRRLLLRFRDGDDRAKVVTLLGDVFSPFHLANVSIEKQGIRAAKIAEKPGKFLEFGKLWRIKITHNEDHVAVLRDSNAIAVKSR